VDRQRRPAGVCAGEHSRQLAARHGQIYSRGVRPGFQIHYTTNGNAGKDVTAVGLIFAKEPPEKRVLTLQLTNDHFVIPPGAPDYRVEARGTLPNDALLLSFFPHMHLRGKQFEYNIVHKDKSVAPLLRVHYHFHWQMSYRLAEPLPLKAGAELQAVAWFDNSKRIRTIRTRARPSGGESRPMTK